jgi:hypothetical protein
MEETPTLPDKATLASLPSSTKDALERAAEEFNIAQRKAEEAKKSTEEKRKNLQDLLTSAKLAPASSTTADNNNNNNGKATQAAITAFVLPEIPQPTTMADKDVTKQLCGALATKFEAFTGEANRPEEVLALWADITWTVEQGVSHQRILSTLALITAKGRAQLCAAPSPKSLEAWRTDLSSTYLAGANRADITKGLANLQRQSTEAAADFILRVTPQVNAAALINVVQLKQQVADLWSYAALGDEWVKANRSFDHIAALINMGKIATMEALYKEAKTMSRVEVIPSLPVAAAPVRSKSKTDGRPECAKCNRRHFGSCWQCEACGAYGHKEGRGPPCVLLKEKANEVASKCMVSGRSKEVCAVTGQLNGQATTLGLDTLAALNLIRRDALPTGAQTKLGGPRLHGVGDAQACGTTELQVRLGDLTFERVPFAIVQQLPVPALLGKPTLAKMNAIMDVAAGKAQIAKGDATTTVHAVAVPVRKDSERPKSHSYWNWINKRFAAADKRLQVLIQDVLERADDGMLEKFLAHFPSWSLEQRQASGSDDPRVHPAPYQPGLRRSKEAVTATGVVVCPILVKAEDIMRPSDPEELVSEADDSKDFLPPVMPFAEEDEKVEKELARLVEESEFSEKGKSRLQGILTKYRAAFGMQLRKVNIDREKVKINLNGRPEHQPRRRIRDPRIMRAQIQWERAMRERGVAGDLTGNPELARPINIHHVIRNGKIRFTTDARPWNDVTVADSFPVPSPMEALDRFRRNSLFSTFDEADSFFQYPLAEDSYVPFYSAEGGILEFRVVIQGGKNSPAALHRAKAKQYQSFSPEELAFMFDDTLLGTEGKEDLHLDLIERFLANCVEHGTILKPSKATIGRAEVKHQGFILGHGYYKKDPEAVRALADMRLPNTATELKSQMSMLGRYREFVPEYAQLAAPLEAIMDKRWEDNTFTARHQERLLEIRRGIAQETMLTMPDWNRPFHWRIDASPTYGWASVMGQEDANGKFWPLRFMSKKASSADKKRWPTEMEAMAWYYCLVDKGRAYSQYSENIIHGDPKSLRWLADSIETGRANRQMQRVALALQATRITFKYHPREEMVDVDALSQFAADRRSSRDELLAFLASDRPSVESSLIVAATMVTREVPPRGGERTEPKVAIPAGFEGPDSPPGVPMDIVAEQKLDPICRFIVTVKRGELADGVAQDQFLSTMPHKAAAALRQFMDEKKSREFHDFEIRKEKLYHKDRDTLGLPRLCLVVPWRLRARVLTANHDAPSAGHVGFQRTYDVLKRLYFWFGMYADTKAWVKSCPCQKGKRRTIAGHGTARHMGLVPMKFRPFERVVIDIIGPLPESRDGMRYILISVDAFSSETKLNALRTRNSEDIANILLQRIILDAGCPKEWQTDRAPELIGAAVAKLSALAGIKAKACSSYQAHTEGRVERRNWLVAMMLREMCKDDIPGWPPMLEFAINSSPYSVTGMTPYFHKTGYDPITPGTAWREVGEESGEPVQTWSDRMCKALTLAELAHAVARLARKRMTRARRSMESRTEIKSMFGFHVATSWIWPPWARCRLLDFWILKQRGQQCSTHQSSRMRP